VIFDDVTATVGGTPLVELGRMAHGLPARVVAKLEMRNPCGSVKDRVGVALIEDAERRGVLRPGMTLVEATGGNTGIGLAFAAAVRGYHLVLTMPHSRSTERVALLRHLGARVVLTPGILMGDAVTEARRLQAMAEDLVTTSVAQRHHDGIRIVARALCRPPDYAAWTSGCVGVQGFCDEKRDMIRTC
jgi:cysteine synthase A